MYNRKTGSCLNSSVPTIFNKYDSVCVRACVRACVEHYQGQLESSPVSCGRYKVGGREGPEPEASLSLETG